MKKDEFKQWAEKVGWIYYGKGATTMGVKVCDEVWVNPQGRTVLVHFKGDNVDMQVLLAGLSPGTYTEK